VQAGIQLGKSVYGSPTTSDQALVNCLSLKMGPGDSARSHSADEFIFVNEIENGIVDYINILQAFFKQAL
jgi:acetylornithine deacetylase